MTAASTIWPPPITKSALDALGRTPLVGVGDVAPAQLHELLVHHLVYRHRGLYERTLRGSKLLKELGFTQQPRMYLPTAIRSATKDMDRRPLVVRAFEAHGRPYQP